MRPTLATVAEELRLFGPEVLLEDWLEELRDRRASAAYEPEQVELYNHAIASLALAKVAVEAATARLAPAKLARDLATHIELEADERAAKRKEAA